MFTGIDLYSDTLTQPTDEMRQAIVSAKLGDEQMGEDSTTNELQEFIQLAEAKGVRFSESTENRIRAVTHLDVNQSQIERVISLVKEL